MATNSVESFCNWWRGLKPAQLPQPSATAEEELKHRHYYTFAEDLRRHWSEVVDYFDLLLELDRVRVFDSVSKASGELVGWIDATAKPTLVGILEGLRNQSNQLLQHFGNPDAMFARRCREWLDGLRASAAAASGSLDSTPPYVSIGAQAGRAELPIRQSTGVWAENGVCGVWPWANIHLIGECLPERPKFGDDPWPVVDLLRALCDGPWQAALVRIPASSASVHSDVAARPWTHAHVLKLVLDSSGGGQLTLQAYQWAQQLLAPFQLWYANLGGVDDLREDAKGVLLIEPILSMNTAFVPPSPRVTYFASSHIRYYCLFLRFLVDHLVAGVADVPKPKAKGKQKHIVVATVSDAIIEVEWGGKRYVAWLRTRRGAAEHFVGRLPASVDRVLKSVQAIKTGPGERVTLKHDDPSRFRSWFRSFFLVVDGSDPLPFAKGAPLQAWHRTHPSKS